MENLLSTTLQIVMILLGLIILGYCAKIIYAMVKPLIEQHKQSQTAQAQEDEKIRLARVTMAQYRVSMQRFDNNAQITESVIASTNQQVSMLLTLAITLSEKAGAMLEAKESLEAIRALLYTMDMPTKPQLITIPPQQLGKLKELGAASGDTTLTAYIMSIRGSRVHSSVLSNMFDVVGQSIGTATLWANNYNVMCENISGEAAQIRTHLENLKGFKEGNRAAMVIFSTLQKIDNAYNTIGSNQPEAAHIANLLTHAQVDSKKPLLNTWTKI